MSAYDPKRKSDNSPKARLYSPIRPMLVTVRTPHKADHEEKRVPRGDDNKRLIRGADIPSIEIRG